MEKNNIRYKITSNTKWFNLSLVNPWCGSHPAENLKEIIFEHYRGYIYFVDILELDRRFAKMRIYFPDGNDLIGWQSIDFIELHYLTDPFDGQFNRI